MDRYRSLSGAVSSSHVARRFVDIATDALGDAREEIDALNVYPVPDGDTGTNMYLTVVRRPRRAPRGDAAATSERATGRAARRWPRFAAARCSAPAATPG